MRTLKKKILFSFLIMIILSIASMTTALAGVSISGSSKVYPGKKYTFTVTVTENASAIMGTAVSNGVLGSQTKTWNKDSSTGLNQSITATTTITVTIPKDAEIGSTGTIVVSGTGASVETSTSSPTKFNISGSKTITVVEAPDPSTPTPTPEPTAWEKAIEDIKKTSEGGSVTVSMDEKDEEEINVPVEAFSAVKDKKAILNINYGSFVCSIDGNKVGAVPSKGTINVGITLKPAERAEDMLTFDLNNKSSLFYVANYTVKPFIEIPDGIMYVYRQYTDTNVLEYVNGAKADGAGNVIVRVFAPGKYIVSSASILGAEGNMDEETFVELFATPTPEPTPEPTATPAATPTPLEEPAKDGGSSSAMAWLLSVLLIILLAALFVVIISQRNK